MLSLIGIPVPLEVIYPSETKFMILAVNPVFEYKNGERLEKQIGIRYSVGCQADCSRFQVKILGKNALCDNDDIANVREPIFAHLVNPVIKEYLLSDGKHGTTVIADDIVLADE